MIGQIPGSLGVLHVLDVPDLCRSKQSPKSCQPTKQHISVGWQVAVTVEECHETIVGMPGLLDMPAHPWHNCDGSRM